MKFVLFAQRAIAPAGSLTGRGEKIPIRSLRSRAGAFGERSSKPKQESESSSLKSRNALCAGIFLACGANRPTPWSRLPGGRAERCP